MKTKDSPCRAAAAELRIAALVLCIFSASLGSLCQPSTPTPGQLIASLSDPDATMRVRAAGTLGYFKIPGAVQPLIKTFNDTDHLVRDTAAWALVEIGGPSEGPTMEALNDPEPTIREQAANVLEQLGAASANDRMLQLLNDPDLKIRMAAAGFFGRTKDERAINPLIAMFSEQDQNLRDQASFALSSYRTPQARKALLASLNSKDKQVRSCAARALAQSKTPEAIPELLKALKDPNEVIRREAADSLYWSHDRRVVQALIDSLAHDKADHVQGAVSRALSMLNDPRAVVPLIRLLKDDDPDVRFRAAFAISHSKDPRIISPLIALLSDSDRSSRYSAAKALGESGDRRAVGPLIAAMNDPDKEVEGAAIEALGQIGDPRALDTLIARLGRRNQPELATAVIGALGRFKDARASKALIDCVEGPSLRFEKGNSARALAETGTGEAATYLFVALAHGDHQVIYGAYRFFIRWGEAGTEDRLIEGLNRGGDVQMARCFAQSGNAKLAKAGRDWLEVALNTGSSGALFQLQRLGTITEAVIWGSAKASDSHAAIMTPQS